MNGCDIVWSCPIDTGLSAYATEQEPPGMNRWRSVCAMAARTLSDMPCGTKRPASGAHVVRWFRPSRRVRGRILLPLPSLHVRQQSTRAAAISSSSNGVQHARNSTLSRLGKSRKGRESTWRALPARTQPPIAQRDQLPAWGGRLELRNPARSPTVERSTPSNR